LKSNILQAQHAHPGIPACMHMNYQERIKTKWGPGLKVFCKRICLE